MTSGEPVTRQVDSKGRITLGKAFANKIVLVEERDDEVVVRLGRVIPVSEAWLYENEKAIGAVRRGLGQARERRFGKGPDLAAARDVADQLQDD